MTKQTFEALISTLGRAPTVFIIKGVNDLIRHAFYPACDREELEQSLTERAFMAKRHYEQDANHRASCETFVASSIMNEVRVMRKRALQKSSREAVCLEEPSSVLSNIRCTPVDSISSIEQAWLSEVLSPTDFRIVQLIMDGKSTRAACQALGLQHVYFARKLRPRLISLFS